MLKTLFAGALMIAILLPIVSHLQNLPNVLQILVISGIGATVYLGISKTVKIL